MQSHEEKIASAGTYIGGALATLSGLSLNEWGVVIGIGVGVGGFAANLWFKYHIIRLAKRSENVRFDVD